MYILFSALFIVCVLFFIIHFYRRKCIIRKICCMDCCQKLQLLNDLAAPFGFSYVPSQDIMTTLTDAWQKNFGYRTLFDKTAFQFNMVFDCEPVYFDYGNRTWRIEFWKGQYGMNIGGEVGIYRADCLLTPDQYDTALFHAIPEEEMFPISMELNHKGKRLFCIRRTHWWLTGFRMGSYCEPEDLTMDVSIAFPCEEMLYCFLESLSRMGYEDYELCICNLTFSFSFSVPHAYQHRCAHKCRVRIAQWKNRIFCKLYCLITRPFTDTMDRILYLYFFLPAAFRHTLRFQKCRKQKCCKKYQKKCCKKCHKKCRKCR